MIKLNIAPAIESINRLSGSMATLSAALRELGRVLPKRRWAKVVRRKS